MTRALVHCMKESNLYEHRDLMPQTEQSAGVDLRSAEEVYLSPGDRVVVRTGLRVATPPETELQIRPRSGFALTEGVTVLNSPGTIDSDYRGEIGVILINHGDKTVHIERGMRIAQAVLSKYIPFKFFPVEKLDETVRGEGGFGSTGV